MKYQSIEEFRVFYNEWKESNQNIREYCKANGFNESQFYYWKKKIEKSSQPVSGKFVPIQMNQVGNDKIQITGTQPNIIPDKKPVSSDDFCEIVYRNGVTLRLKSNISIEMLKTLITLYP